VIGRKPGRPTAKDKTGIVFSLEHRPGSLYRALGVLHRNKINMTKIISRPKPQMIGEYNFFVEVEGHRNNPRIKEALRRLLRHTLALTVAGSYPLIKLK
jgi:prephenate dehydratase